MRRTVSPSGRPSGGVVLAALVLLVFALAPASVTSWVGVFRGPLQTVVAPVSGPMTALGAWLRPAVRRAEAERATAGELERQRDRYRLQLERANQRIAELERRLESVEGWRATVGPGVAARWAKVVGRELEAGTISVRGGRGAGVPLGAVAVDAASRQLIGRVVANGPNVSTVRLLTAEVEGPERWLRCVLFPADEMVTEAGAQAALPRVDLELSGGVRFRSDEAGLVPGIELGAEAKIDDSSWPAEAQMLVVGTVAEVEETGEPGFVRVVVEPTVDNLGGVLRVVLLVPREEGEGDGVIETPGEAGNGFGGAAGGGG